MDVTGVKLKIVCHKHIVKSISVIYKCPTNIDLQRHLLSVGSAFGRS